MMVRRRISRGEAAGQGLRETPERARHAAGIVDRPTGTAIGAPVGRLVQTPLDRLAARATITPRMHSAGQRLRWQFEVGVLGVRDRDGELPLGIRSTATVLTPGEVQLESLRAYRTALRRLGGHVGAVVDALCCHEQDVRAIATRQGRSRDKVMGVLEDGLKTLADHYRLTGRDDPDPGKHEAGSRRGPRPRATGVP